MKYSRLKSIYSGIITVILLFIIQGLYSQTIVSLSVSQPSELVANAGDSATINAGENIVIGGSPTATGGVSPYSYSWNYESYLDDPAIPNPTATPSGNINFTVTVTDYNGCTDSDAVFITVEGGSSIYDLKTNISLNIYPNPSSGSFTLAIDNIINDSKLRIAIISLSGQKAYEKTFDVKLRLEEEIDISQWPKGFYIIIIDGESTHLTKQLILH